MKTVLISTLMLLGPCSALDAVHRVLLQPPDPEIPPDPTTNSKSVSGMRKPPLNPMSRSGIVHMQNDTTECGGLNQQCCRNPGMKYAQPYCNSNGRRFVCRADADSQLLCVGCGFNDEPCCFRKSKLTGLSYVCQLGPNGRGACSTQDGSGVCMWAGIRRSQPAVKCETYQLTALLPATSSSSRQRTNLTFPFNVTVCVSRDVRKQPNELQLTWTVTNTVTTDHKTGYVDFVDYAKPVDQNDTQVNIPDPELLQGLLNQTMFQANWGVVAEDELQKDLGKSKGRKRPYGGRMRRKTSQNGESPFWEFVLSSSTQWGLMMVTPMQQNTTDSSGSVTSYRYDNLNNVTKVTVSKPVDLPNGAGKEFSAVVTLNDSVTSDMPLVLGMAAKIYAINSSRSDAVVDTLPSPSHWSLDAACQGVTSEGSSVTDAFRHNCSWVIEL